MPKIRVLVVEDSLTVREHLIAAINSDPELEVVASAGDGKAAIELCQSLRPDVISLDMMLPVMTGLSATEYIMAHCPTPIVIVSASTNRGELFRTYEALAAGALDVLEKPTGEEIDGVWERKLLATLKLVSRIRVITHLRAKLRGSQRDPAAAASPASARGADPARVGPRSYELVAIGASTGGPGTVAQLLQELPSNFPLPILLVIHISEPFAAAFADWLDGSSPLRVTYARDGEPLPLPGKGRVIMAPANRHLVIRGERLRLLDTPERHSCRPSVDELFESVASELRERAIGCLLTGMGKDGAQGLGRMRASGATTIAQDEATSVVFGMPREAILLGAAERVLPAGELAPMLSLLAGVASRRRS